MFRPSLFNVERLLRPFWKANPRKPKLPSVKKQLVRGYQNFVMNDTLAQLERECERYCPVPRFPLQKVTVVGAGSDVGRIACLFLKQQKVVKCLAMYDEYPQSGVLGVANDIAHIDTSCRVVAFQGRMYLKDALHEADVVLICGGAYLPPPHCFTMDRDLFFQNMQHVRTATIAIAQFCPHAIVAVQTPPVDCNFALCAHTLKLAKVYDKRRVLGVNSVNAMRANQLFSTKMGTCDPATCNIPVVCGCGRCTRVPVFSVGKSDKCCAGPDQSICNCLSRLVREADDLICRVKSNNEQGHLSIGFSTARFVINLMKGLFESTAFIDSALVEQGNPEQCYGMKYCATPVKVGKGGVVEYEIPTLNAAEKELLEQSKCDLEDMLNLGKCFALGDEYYLHPCKCYPAWWCYKDCEVCKPCEKCDLKDMLHLGKCFALGDEYSMHPCKTLPYCFKSCKVCQPCERRARIKG
ncbi:hypothetical protein PYW08_002369 [Mythimna loreyi]|uniref:Uncharacterized protein n=1 Tax=Mythimna loreyi TaxID=667449 RepID=A0ACC2R6U2_9NEOP|nr:hypothetical protein PYW08_002369 [Mythimna loreyi]